MDFIPTLRESHFTQIASINKENQWSTNMDSRRCLTAIGGQMMLRPFTSNQQVSTDLGKLGSKCLMLSYRNAGIVTTTKSMNVNGSAFPNFGHFDTWLVDTIQLLVKKTTMLFFIRTGQMQATIKTHQKVLVLLLFIRQNCTMLLQRLSFLKILLESFQMR